MNEARLIVTGRCAMSWLAGQSYKIGLEAPALYLHGIEGQFLKLDQTTCVIYGETLAADLGRQWQRSKPEGLVFHQLNEENRVRLQGMLGPLM